MNLFAGFILMLLMYIAVFSVIFLAVGVYLLLPSSFRKKLEDFIDHIA